MKEIDIMYSPQKSFVPSLLFEMWYETFLGKYNGTLPDPIYPHRHLGFPPIIPRVIRN